MSSPLSAYDETLAVLRLQLVDAMLDHEAFERPMQACQLSRCRATCCHDGAVLSAEEAAVIALLPGRHPALFASSAAGDVPPIEHSPPVIQTATRPARREELADDFPGHFPRTRCVFLQPDHRCTLQVLSASLGHHPWFYKPVSCWMHPVLLLAPGRAGRARLTLRGPDDDETRFATCTPCGSVQAGGPPAREVLAPELEALSQIAGRDFLGELNATPGESLRGHRPPTSGGTGAADPPSA